MTVPICPNHPQGPKPMQAGKGGAWFCPNRMADQSWCKHRVAGVPQGAAAVPVPAAHLSSSTGGGGEVLAAAALTAASRVYSGAGPEFEAQVIQTAQRFYAAMKALVA